MNNRVFPKLALTSLVTFLPFVTMAAVAQDSAAPPVSAKAAVANTATVTLDSAAYSRFDTIFQAVSEQAHVLIIAEGTPLNLSLSTQQLETLRQAVPEGQPVAVGVAIKNIALAYDYDMDRQTDADTFLLRKRYSDANDLPCVTFEEVFSSLREIRKVLRHDGDGNAVDALDSDATLRKFVDSLTPAQLQRDRTPDPRPTPSTLVVTNLDASNPGIMLSDLSPAQQELGMTTLKDAVLNRHLETIDLVVQRFFKTLESGMPDFRWVDAKPSRSPWIRVLGIQGAFGAGGKQERIPFASPFKFESSIDTHYIEVPAAQLTPVNPLVPTAQDRALASGMMANRLPGTMTLQEAAQEAAKTLPISSPAADSTQGATGGSAARATAVKAIADKPVNVFGMRYGHDVRHLMQSLADLYGLQMLVPSQNSYALALPEQRAVDNPADFPKELQRLTPLPLRRAMIGQRTAIAAFIASSPEEVARLSQRIPEGMSDEQASRMQKSIIASAAQSKAHDAFYYPAARRLLALKEPKIPGPNAPPVPVRALAPEADRLLALMMLSGIGMSELQSLQRFTPPQSLTQPGTAHFQVFRKETPNSRTYMVGIYHVNPDGSFVSDGILTSYIFQDTSPKAPPQSGGAEKPRN